jgi:hypothetical protein
MSQIMIPLPPDPSMWQRLIRILKKPVTWLAAAIIVAVITWAVPHFLDWLVLPTTPASKP